MAVDPTVFLGLLGAMLWVFVIFFVVMYVYSAITLMAIAKRTNTPNGWLAWIPFANIYLMTQIAGLSGLWTLAILLAIIPFVGGVAVMALAIWWWWKIAERVGRPGWWAILMLIPVVNFVIMGMLAWGKSGSAAPAQAV